MRHQALVIRGRAAGGFETQLERLAAVDLSEGGQQIRGSVNENHAGETRREEITLQILGWADACAGYLMVMHCRSVGRRANASAGYAADGEQQIAQRGLGGGVV